MKQKNQIVRLFTIPLIVFICTVIGCGGSSSSSDDNGSNSSSNNDSGSNSDTDSDNDNDLVANDFTGTWLIRKEDTTSFWIFREDGTFEKKRAGESLNGASHFSGTYSVSGGFLMGDFTNPGVGAGEIQGTIDEDGTLLMDFIEYWHTPPKVVATTGVRQ